VSRMNTGLQHHQMRETLRARGVDPAAVDIDAWLDSSLHLDENIQAMEEAGVIPAEDQGRNMTAAGARREGFRAVKRHADEVMARRDPLDEWADQVQEAETVLDADSREQEELFDRWEENPDELDVRGVDDKSPVGLSPALERWEDLRLDMLEAGEGEMLGRSRMSRWTDRAKDAERDVDARHLTQDEFEEWREDQTGMDVGTVDDRVEEPGLAPALQDYREREEEEEEAGEVLFYP